MSETQKIKLLQLCAVDFTVKNLLLPLIDRLEAENFAVRVACSAGPEKLELKARGYCVQNIEIDRSVSFFSNIRSMAAIFRYLLQERFDIIHVHTPVAAILGRVAGRLARVPLIVYTAHGFYFHDRMPTWTRQTFFWIEKLAGKYCTDLLFVQSQEDYEMAVRSAFLPAERIVHIGNGVNLKRFASAEPEKRKSRNRNLMGISERAKVIGFVGRIVAEKGILELLEAFRSIHQAFSDCRLLIVGDNSAKERDTDTINVVYRLIEQYQLQDAVIFAGYRSDIEELMAVMDVFVLPSHREGMPRSIIEAMASSLPVVASNIRGCREEVVDGVTGLLVPVNQPVALAAAITTILQDAVLARKMGEQALINASAQFDEEKVLALQIAHIKQRIGQAK